MNIRSPNPDMRRDWTEIVVTYDFGACDLSASNESGATPRFPEGTAHLLQHLLMVHYWERIERHMNRDLSKVSCKRHPRSNTLESGVRGFSKHLAWMDSCRRRAFPAVTSRGSRELDRTHKMHSAAATR
jgi:hypothetical protein